jgi:hypothetical protein
LQVDLSIISRDVYFLRQQARHNIKRYIDERLPEEYEKCLVGLTTITKEAWNTAHDPEYKREKIHALSLAKECYSMKLDLLTNTTVVDDAIRFEKEGVDKPIYDYQRMIFESLATQNSNVNSSNKHLWIKKATGLGISELCGILLFYK